MPFSKKNPPVYLDKSGPSWSQAKRQEKKANRKSSKLSPTVSKAQANWQRQCRLLAKKPIEEVGK
jgi:hypothetical protein